MARLRTVGGLAGGTADLAGDQHHGAARTSSTSCAGKDRCRPGRCPTPAIVPWRSSGWTNGKNVMKMLEIMELRGEVAVASREGRERNWDLAERIWADDPADAPSLTDARAERRRRRLAALGIERRTPSAIPPPGALHVRVEGVRGSWFVDPEPAGSPRRAVPRSVRAALAARPAGLRPPAAARPRSSSTTSWRCTSRRPSAAGATGRCPCSRGDRLIGKLDATADHTVGSAAGPRPPPRRRADRPRLLAGRGTRAARPGELPRAGAGGRARLTGPTDRWAGHLSRTDRSELTARRRASVPSVSDRRTAAGRSPARVCSASSRVSGDV